MNSSITEENSDPTAAVVSYGSVIFFSIQYLVQTMMIGAISKMPPLSVEMPEILHASSLIISSCNSSTLLTMIIIFRKMLPCWIYQFCVQLIPGAVVSPLTSLLFEVWMVIRSRVNYPQYAWIDSKCSSYARSGLFIHVTMFIDVPIGILCASVAYIVNPELMNSSSNSCQIDTLALVFLAIRFAIHATIITILYTWIVAMLGPHNNINHNYETKPLDMYTKTLIFCHGLSMFYGVLIVVPYLMDSFIERFEELMIDYTGVSSEMLAIMFNSIPLVCFMAPIAIINWYFACHLWISEKRFLSILGCCFVSGRSKIKKIFKKKKRSGSNRHQEVESDLESEYEIELEDQNLIRGKDKPPESALNVEDDNDSELEFEINIKDIGSVDISVVSTPKIEGNYKVTQRDIPMENWLSTKDRRNTLVHEVSQALWMIDVFINHSNVQALKIEEMNGKEVLARIVYECGEILKKYSLKKKAVFTIFSSKNKQQDYINMELDYELFTKLESLMVVAIEKKLLICESPLVGVVTLDGENAAGNKKIGIIQSKKLSSDIITWMLIVALKSLEKLQFNSISEWPEKLGAIRNALERINKIK